MPVVRRAVLGEKQTWVQLDNLDSCQFRRPDVTGLKKKTKSFSKKAPEQAEKV